LVPSIVNTLKCSYLCMYNITEKMNLLKMCGPQIWLCLFTFRPIASKQLKSLTTIDILSWLGGAVVTHPPWVQEVPGSIPISGRGFYVRFFVLLLLCFYFLSKNTLFVTKVCKFFFNVILFSILNILQDLWPIIRVLRYIRSIFKIVKIRFIIQVWSLYTCQIREKTASSTINVGPILDSAGSRTCDVLSPYSRSNMARTVQNRYFCGTVLFD